MITLDSGQLHGGRFDPHISSVAAKERCTIAVKKFNSGGASMSSLRRIVIAYLLLKGYIWIVPLFQAKWDPTVVTIGLHPPSKNRNSNTPNNSADKSSDFHAKTTSIRILVIDDDPTMREAIGYLLEDLQIEFDAVSSGEEGLAKLEEQSYDLVFLDLVLHTGSHGTEIFKRLRERSKHLRIVLMTASGSREPIFEEASKLQRSILRKPFSLDEVERIIDAVKEKPK